MFVHRRPYNYLFRHQAQHGLHGRQTAVADWGPSTKTRDSFFQGRRSGRKQMCEREMFHWNGSEKTEGLGSFSYMVSPGGHS